MRHCHRRSRESDAQLPLPQLLVTARRVPRAEHVTPRPQRTQSSTASQRSPSVMSATASGPIKGSLDLAPSARAAAHATGTRCCEATKLTRPDSMHVRPLAMEKGRNSLLPGMPGCAVRVVKVRATKEESDEQKDRASSRSQSDRLSVGWRASHTRGAERDVQHVRPEPCARWATASSRRSRLAANICKRLSNSGSRKESAVGRSPTR